MIQRLFKCIDGLHVICHLYFSWYVGSISMLVVIESDVSLLFLLVCCAWFCSYRFDGMRYWGWYCNIAWYGGKVSSRITWDTCSHLTNILIIFYYMNRHIFIEPSFLNTSEWSKWLRACQLQHSTTLTMTLRMRISFNFQLFFHNLSTPSCQVFMA
jgi:hypothetical protein